MSTKVYVLAVITQLVEYAYGRNKTNEGYIFLCDRNDGTLFEVLAAAHRKPQYNSGLIAYKSDFYKELSVAEKEGRTLLIEVPLIGTALMVAYKVTGLISSIIGPIIEYKLAAFTIIANVTSWLYQNYFPIAIGTVVLIGIFFITSTLAEAPEIEMDHRLIQVARQLDMGLFKYSKIIN